MIIAQLSDTHIAKVGAKIGEECQTAAHLARAVAHLNNLPARPDLVIITGDCVDKGSAEEYQRLRELLRPLKMPFYLIPGNHDDRVQLRQAFGTQGDEEMTDFIQYVVNCGEVRLLALDTNIPGEDGGYLCQQRLDWLAAQLAAESSRPTIIFLHHPPFVTGITSLDNMGLAGKEALGEIVARHSNIERIVAGHVHCALQRRFYGSIALTCPSTAHQVFLDLKRPECLSMVMETPACLIHAWQPATGLVTHTSLIGDFGPVKEVFDGIKWLPL
jgi:3',5'-cyclic-AMP phosphodiesterase